MPSISPLPLLATCPYTSKAVNRQTGRRPSIHRTRRRTRLLQRQHTRGTRRPRYYHGGTGVFCPSKSSGRRRRLCLQMRRNGNRRRQGQRTMNTTNRTNRRTNRRDTRRPKRRVRHVTRVTPLLFRHYTSRPYRVSTRRHTRSTTTMEKSRHGNSSTPSLTTRRGVTTRYRPSASNLISGRLSNRRGSLPTRRGINRVQSTRTTMFTLRLIRPVIRVKYLRHVMFQCQ